MIYIVSFKQNRRAPHQQLSVTLMASYFLQRFLMPLVERDSFFQEVQRKTIKALFGLISLDALWAPSKQKRTCYLNKASFSNSVLSFAFWRQTFLRSCKEAKAFFWYEGDNCHTMSFPWWSLQLVAEGKGLKCTVVQCSKGKLQREERRAGPFSNSFSRFQSHNQAFLM